jgi:hypothetical protein
MGGGGSERVRTVLYLIRKRYKESPAHKSRLLANAGQYEQIHRTGSRDRIQMFGQK